MMTHSNPKNPLWVIIRGGGDLASGVALRLHRAGLRLWITELSNPLVVRRKVAFAEAVFDGQTSVEGVPARRVESFPEAAALAETGVLPVMIDPELTSLKAARSAGATCVLVDARMTKQPASTRLDMADLVIGLGPGFTPGVNCHAAVETNRGHRLGRVLWRETPEPDTGIPDRVVDRGAERVLRAPADGVVQGYVEIGDRLQAGQVVAEVAGQPVRALFPGVLRGLIRSGLPVTRGVKIGDVDPRDDPRYSFLVSDKSLAVGGGVLEAILSRPELRPYLWNGCP
jgi:xanthine dehydrogenase accessory factor